MGAGPLVGDVVDVETRPMHLMGLTRADLIDGLEEAAGTATALAATEGATTRFI